MPYTRPYSGGFQDFPNTGTPINAAALNTIDLGAKAANDQIQTLTTAQRTALTPTVGQMVWDSTLNEFFVYLNSNGGNAWQGFGNSIICTSTTRPLSPFAGMKIYETDTKRSLVYEAAAWRLDTFNRYARAKRTSGNITLNSSLTWANVDTGTDLTLNAATGDVIEYSISAYVATAAVETYFDVVTLVSGSPVNSFGYDAAPANPNTFNGIAGWTAPSSVVCAVSGNFYRTLLAGDISSGTVTLRLRYATSSATARTITASANQPLEVFARNHGQVTT